MKYLKIGTYEIYAFALIAFAIGLRMLLAGLNWPPSNSDEGTMGIMALHIAYKGEHPLVYYGQSYMGTLEAYLGAMFFHLFGPSLFTLRLSVILLVALFFVSTYLLASMLYAKPLALVTLAVLSIGSIPYLTRQIIATGGSSQTLLFGSVAFLLASWLSLTYRSGFSLRIKLWRLAGYFVWGMAIGLGIWSDMIVLPFFIFAALLLFVFCWRELLVWAWIGVLLGVIVGGMPEIYYNILMVRQGQNSLDILLGLFRGTTTQAPHTLHEILHGVQGTLLVSLPTATANPFCPVSELPFLSDNVPQTPACNVVHFTWSLSYLVLLVAGLLLTLVALWKVFTRPQADMGTLEKRQLVVRYTARLALLLSGGLTLSAYSLSSAPMGWPGFHARYIIGLLMITPAIIDPLWQVASKIKLHKTRPELMGALAGQGVFAVIGMVLLIGTIITFSEVPAAQAASRQQTDFINNLVRVGATHIITDYWTCDDIAFISNERIICGVVDGNLQSSHNRDPHYWGIVSNDPHTAYAFPVGSGQLPAADRKAASSPGKYQRYSFDGYVVYVPK